MRRSLLLFACAALVAAMIPAGAADPPDFDYATPLFGLNADSEGNLIVADTGQGIVSLSETEGSLVAELPGVTDAVQTEAGDYVAATGEPPEEGVEGASTLYRVTDGSVTPIADLLEFEEANNPDQNDPLIGPDNVESNPFDLARIEGATLVADAAGNVLLEVADDGTVDWMALFPAQAGASTAPLKEALGCPDVPDDLAELCDLPPELDAQPVPTSVAVGPDGSYYVGELTGFPATPGLSRIWKVEPGTSQAQCPGDGCTQVFADHSFTAIIDLAFGPDGTLYVLELDEAGFMAAEFEAGTGGTLNACKLDSESCVELQTGLFISTATTSTNGSVFATTGALVPDLADVIEIGKEFSDDNGSVHELDIALLAAAGITRGCNPPDNDMFCPDNGTTRGQMAAFLVRALGLPAAEADAFGDDDENVFEGDINALAAADITRGCNPPDNDQFCPEREVTRAEMAAFLVRALSLGASDVDGFVDDDGIVFEGDIDALKAAGVTFGCNPPANDRYCPDDIVTRAQMASFLIRGLDDLS